MRNISILGSTGSIGTQTLDIARQNKDIKVKALAAGNNVKELAKQIREFEPELACISTDELAKELKILIGDMNVKIVTGMEGLIEAATYASVDIVVTAIVGMIGIIPTIEAIKCKKDIALANKETLVTAGHIIMPLAKEYGVNILPVDSEHSAIFQCLNGEGGNRISKLLLTASGGPFRGRTIEQMQNITVEDALKHPNWAMGQKITIDSATMVNKGLEVMEAKWLFDVDIDRIEVVVHPQSIIHSMVEFDDGGIMAQLGSPDMRLPIQYALYYPERRILNSKRLNFADIAKLTFEAPDFENFRGLKLAFEVAAKGGNMPVIYNAANEYLVSRFLNRKIEFLDIPKYINESIEHFQYVENPTVKEIIDMETAVYEYLGSRC
ncbi:MAG: 1-deoxy-D-xylulose-5-phosphate reductoisomerase [Lachnospiraceae bacterium]|nr:1-deoxy-D-xylulose-5-phosphate reductoisomerase [Lachnospiraceae bacterium]